MNAELVQRLLSVRSHGLSPLLFLTIWLFRTSLDAFATLGIGKHCFAVPLTQQPHRTITTYCYCITGTAKQTISSLHSWVQLA